MADDSDPNRPSFSDFWRKSKEALGGKKIRFVESKPGQNASASGAQDEVFNETPQDKAQARRAQVRKAQVQHRQRKANYVKQLEMDVARIREMIEAAEQDTKNLLDENRAMRAQLVQAINKKAAPLSLDQGVSLLQEIPPPCQLSDVGESLQQRGPEEVAITLGFDEIMNAPTFYISSPPSSVTHTHQHSPQGSPPTGDSSFPDLDPAQTQAAINFILALEHLCRAHYHPSNYAPPPPDTVYSTPLIGHEGHGHTLMATSLALRDAPEHIFKAASRSDRLLFPSTPPIVLPPTATTPPPNPPTNIITTTNPNPNNDNTTNSDPSLTWRTSSLTLRALHGLASSLNPDDGVEVAPVQAWFELVRRFGARRVAAPGVLDRLRRELVGVVKCPHYGASMERGAFESVVGRVLGAEGGADGDADGDGGEGMGMEMGVGVGG